MITWKNCGGGILKEKKIVLSFLCDGVVSRGHIFFRIQCLFFNSW